MPAPIDQQTELQVRALMQLAAAGQEIATSADGVSVKMDASFHVTDVTIDPARLITGGGPRLEKAISSAMNEAIQKVSQAYVARATAGAASPTSP
jgi:DNA-binding protein YbaB